MEITNDEHEKIVAAIKIINEIINKNSQEQKLIIDYPFKGNYGISQYFGEHPELYAKYGFAGHFGIDFLTPWATEILAVDDGEISRVGYSEGNGYFVELKHTWGYSFYCHFKEASTRTINEKVKKGNLIGLAGNTGVVYSSQPAGTPYRGTHLHFSIKVTNIKNEAFKDWINPLPYFKN